MRYDTLLLFSFIALGLSSKRLTWRGWFGVSALVFVWIMFNWKKG